MSDEITKPIVETTETPVIEEPTISETVIEPVTAEAPAVESPESTLSESDPTLVTNHLPLEPNPTPLEPNSTTEPIVVTEPAVIEKPVVEEPTAIPESKSTQEVVSEPSLETSHSSLEPNLIPEPPLVTNHSPLEPNPTLESNLRPYSLDPKLNKAIEAFVRGMNNSKQNLILAKKAVKAKMMKRVYKIMELFDKKHARTPIGNRIGVGETKIKNDDVEKFLHTSDKTATKYLNILTKEGKIKREGNPHNPYYTKTE